MGEVGGVQRGAQKSGEGVSFVACAWDVQPCKDGGLRFAPGPSLVIMTWHKGVIALTYLTHS